MEDDDSLNWWQKILAAPLYLVGCVITTVLTFGIPVFLFALLVWGPSETWDRTKRMVGFDGEGESGACANAGPWLSESNNRAEEAFNLQNQLIRRDLDTSSELSVAEQTFRDYSTAQTDSNPPDAGQELNSAMADGFQMIADMTEAIRLQDTGRMFALQNQVEEFADEVDRLDREFRQTCF